MGLLIGRQLRAFRRRKSLAFLALGFGASVLALGSYELMLVLRHGLGGFDALSFSTRYSLLWPVFLVVMTYEFLSGPRHKHMEEAVEAHIATAHGHWLAMLSIPAMLLLIAFALYLSLRLIVVHLTVPTAALYWHATAEAVLDILFPSTVAILLGFVLARKIRRFPAYAAITLFVLLIGPYSEIVPFTVQFATLETGRIVDLYPAYDVFRILAPDPTWVVDSFYGFPLEFQRWMLAGFWMLGLGSLSVSALVGPRGRVKHGLRVLLAAAAVVFLGLALLPGSQVRRDYRPSGVTFADSIYYEIEGELHPQEDVAADFAVTRYEMDLVARRELNAVVVLDLAQDSHDGVYRFTLYRGYRVSCVRSGDGDELEFVQRGDYLTVKSEESHAQLRLEYHGNGNRQVANYQAVFLPGYFPYYPVPGFHSVWDTQKHGLRTSVVGRQPAEFSVAVDAPVPVTSNLTRQTGRFVGTSVCPTFMGGLLARTQVEGHDVAYFPSTGSNADGLAEQLAALEDLERRLGATRSAVDDSAVIFQLPELAQSNVLAVVLPDTVFVSLFDPEFASEIAFAGASMRADRANLIEAISLYVSHTEQFKQESEAIDLPGSEEVAALESARLSAEDPAEMMIQYQVPAKTAVFRLFYEKMRLEGEDGGLRSTYEYLISADPSSELEFLTSEIEGAVR